MLFIISFLKKKFYSIENHLKLIQKMLYIPLYIFITYIFLNSPHFLGSENKP